MGIIPNNKTTIQYLFEKENPKYIKVLMKTLDFITKKEGTGKIKLASQDLKKNLENETNQAFV